MIQPLRAVHRSLFVALTLVLPTILFWGLEARHPRLGPGANATGEQSRGDIVSESSNLWQKHSIRSTFYRKADHSPGRYVMLLPAQEWNEPDLLLYWTPDAPQGSVLPADAQLLGAFSPSRAFLLPLDHFPLNQVPLNQKDGGHLVLFSLAHQNVFDTAVVGKLP